MNSITRLSVIGVPGELFGFERQTGGPFNVSVTETITLTDIQHVSYTGSVNQTETVTLTDINSASKVTSASRVEVVTLSDINSVQYTGSTTRSEVVVLSDTNHVQATFGVSVSEIVATTDSSIAGKAFNASVTEIVVVTDVAHITVGIPIDQRIIIQLAQTAIEIKKEASTGIIIQLDDLREIISSIIEKHIIK